MGTDIHGVFQRHNPTTNKWEDVPSEYEFNRHYQLFAVLAGVAMKLTWSRQTGSMPRLETIPWQ